MNFLCHDYVLPAGSRDLTRVGSALPDLWPLLPKRSLPLLVIRELRAMSENDSAAALVAGIDSHLRSDALFHGHPEFLRRVALLTPPMAQAWPAMRHAGIAAHVLVEMLLDRWLMRRQPARLDAYYAAFTPEAIALACRWTTSEPSSAQALERLLRVFVDSAFLRDYQDTTGLAGRFLRTFGRTPLATEPPPVDRIAKLVDEVEGHLTDGSQALLDAVRLA